MRHSTAMLLTTGLLAFGGPSGCQTTGSADRIAEPLRIAPGAPRSAALGKSIDVSAELVNRTDDPVALLSVQVRAFGATVLDMRARDDFKGFRGEPGHATLTGDFEMEEIGPAARLPMPPRWEWEGDTAFVNPPVLAPGASVAITATARPLSYDDPRVTVEVRFAVLAKGTELFTANGWKTQHVDDADLAGAPHGMGWTTKLQKIIALVPGDGTSSRSALPLPSMPGGPLPDPAAALSLYPHFIAKSTLEHAAPADARSVREIAIEDPAFKLAAARARAAIPTGAAIYLAAASAWWLDDAKGGALVSAQRVARVAGGARALVERLAADGQARVTAMLGDAEAKALQARFTGQTMTTSTAPAKGGGVILTVIAPASDVFAFLDVLTAGKVGLDGLRIVPATK